MKKLTSILKGIDNSRIQLRENKIKRHIEAAVSTAEENILDQKDRSLEILEELKDSEDINEVLNKYVECKITQLNWEYTKKYLEDLKETLNEEI